MNIENLRRLAWQAGYLLDQAALPLLTGKHPDAVTDWVCAAAEHTATDTTVALLRAAADTLRGRLAGTEATHLYLHAGELAGVCEALAEAEQAREEALARCPNLLHSPGRP